MQQENSIDIKVVAAGVYRSISWIDKPQPASLRVPPAVKKTR